MWNHRFAIKLSFDFCTSKDLELDFRLSDFRVQSHQTNAFVMWQCCHFVTGTLDPTSKLLQSHGTLVIFQDFVLNARMVREFTKPPNSEIVSVTDTRTRPSPVARCSETAFHAPNDGCACASYGSSFFRLVDANVHVFSSP